jgi:hypothetical protein
MQEIEQKRKGYCACGCELFGTLRKRPVDHVKDCKCKQCMGKRNRSKGDSKARHARKVLGLGGANSRHEEVWGGPIRVEVKAGKQVQPIYTRFLLAEQQSKQGSALGDIRPFAMVAMPEGTSDGLVIMRLSEFQNFMALLNDL